MRIDYVTSARIPTEKAHGYQIMRICSELSNLGHEVSLYIPDRINSIKDNPFDFYGIERNFDLFKVGSFDWISKAPFLGPLSYYLGIFSFLRSLPKEISNGGGVVISRNSEVCWFFSKKGRDVFYNAHNWPSHNFPITYFLKNIKGVISNSKGTESAVRGALNVPTTFVYNATDPNPYTNVSKEDLRRELNLPIDKKIVMYTGHLYEWKGVEVIINVAQMSGQEINFVFVGGEDRAVGNIKKRVDERNIKNVSFLGHKSKSLIPKYLAASDVLVLPNIPTTKESINYTSPIKLFEYMASGVPIVASNLPSIREILNDGNSVLVEAGNPKAFLAGIEKVLGGQESVKEKAERALEESYQYTWGEVARKISDFIKETCEK